MQLTADQHSPVQFRVLALLLCQYRPQFQNFGPFFINRDYNLYVLNILTNIDIQTNHQKKGG